MLSTERVERICFLTIIFILLWNYPIRTIKDSPQPKENYLEENKTKLDDGIPEVPHNQPTDQAMIREIMKNRRNLIKEKCEENILRKLPPVSSRTKVSGRLIHMPSKNVIWCPVYKSSTSSWLNYLLDISDLSDQEKIQRKNRYGVEGKVSTEHFIYLCKICSIFFRFQIRPVEINRW